MTKRKCCRLYAKWILEEIKRQARKDDTRDPDRIPDLSLVRNQYDFDWFIESLHRELDIL